MSQVFHTEQLDWTEIRPEVAQQVTGKTLLKRGTKVVLTRVEPNGAFEGHRDDYHHLFYFLNGRGVLQIEDKSYEIRPGVVAQIEAGETHSYRNTGQGELTLISLNLPAVSEDQEA